MKCGLQVGKTLEAKSSTGAWVAVSMNRGSLFLSQMRENHQIIDFLLLNSTHGMQVNTLGTCSEF